MSLEVDIEKTLGDFTLRASFSAGTGITGLLGASGSGKSLTLRCIAGICRPDRGRIVLDGKALFDAERGINLPPQRRELGFLFQSYALFPHMTVEQNILCGLSRVRNRRERRRLAAEAMHRFSLEELAGHRPAQLSGGQAQRTALARIMVSRPRLLLLDEPFSALDSHLRLRLQLELRETLDAWDCPVLLVTHSRDEAYHMCSRLALANGGAVGETRPLKEAFADPGSFPAARLTGCKNIAPGARQDARSVSVPNWNVTLTAARDLLPELTGVAFRAHALSPDCGENCFPVEYAGELEEPFAWVLLFRFRGQDPRSPALWWRLPKDRRPARFPERLGIPAGQVLPLYGPQE
ncbi:MAG: ATP-binding cassette domain-containing protein [Oscillospiraceae bacterium]|nr:ATP-binding cassette domain-containing protein [Oscillospiraceae bacterium]